MASRSVFRVVPTGGASKVNDDWTPVQDKKLRKKIQDRLAQRARRKRIADSKQEDSSEDVSEVQSSTQAIIHIPASQHAPQLRSSQSFPNISVREPYTITGQFTSILSALRANSLLIQTAEEQAGLLKSDHCSMSLTTRVPFLPDSLQATDLQLSTLHYGTIDVFPFPFFRDNFILMQSLVDPTEFMYDLLNMNGFWVVPGRPAWDATAWRVSDEFRLKWGYLFLEIGSTEMIDEHSVRTDTLI